MNAALMPLRRPSAVAAPAQNLFVQRKCACGAGAAAGESCASCAREKKRRLQARLQAGAVDDPLEREADRVADQVLSDRPAVANSRPAHAVQRVSRVADGEGGEVPASVEYALAGSGRPLEPALRRDMEQRFGHDFARVRVHDDAAAQRSAQDVSARAYTAGGQIAFAAGEFRPDTREGRHLLAHELAHVAQQSGTGSLIQRAPSKETESKYKALVKKGTWCRDSEKTGELHPGLQCYREVPAAGGYPPGGQFCFSKSTGQFVESSPDHVSAVSGQYADGTCNIPAKATDPPQPFTQRGRRALGHGIADVATEDPDLIGRHFGRISGVAMGIALPKDGLNSDLAGLAVPAILGYLGAKIGERGLPLLNGLARKHGFLPSISAGLGSNLGLGLGVGYEKRDRALPLVPVSSYLTFALDSSLSLSGDSDTRSTFIAKVGIRMDPGQQGGVFATGAIGAGLAAGKELSGVTSAEVGVGIRATEFLDVQLVRESVSDSADSTYWVTLKLVAPRRVYKGHGP